MKTRFANSRPETVCTRSADLQSAVSQNCILRGFRPSQQLGSFSQPADCKSAIQQTASPRYLAPRETRPVLFRRGQARERGSAVVVFLALLAIMLVLVAANGRTLLLLKKEMRLIEQRQIQRLERSQTNAPAPATLEAKPIFATP